MARHPRTSWLNPSVGLVIAYLGVLAAMLLGVYLNGQRIEQIGATAIESSLARCNVARDTREVIRSVLKEGLSTEADRPLLDRLLLLAPPLSCTLDEAGLFVPREVDRP